jgi:hypothetical protein
MELPGPPPPPPPPRKGYSEIFTWAHCRMRVTLPGVLKARELAGKLSPKRSQFETSRRNLLHVLFI